MADIKHIMVVCGTVNDCGALIHSAARLARSVGAQLFILTVIYNPFGLKGLSLPRPSFARDYQRLYDKIKDNMHSIIALEKQQGIAIEHMIRDGKPVDMILDEVQKREIDLLVLPAHEEGRIEHVLFGGKNKDLLRKMPCSMLFIKSEPVAIEEDEEEDEEEWGTQAAG
jgi:nucleotide-binding universal stress UspA family protein